MKFYNPTDLAHALLRLSFILKEIANDQCSMTDSDNPEEAFRGIEVQSTKAKEGETMKI